MSNGVQGTTLLATDVIRGHLQLSVSHTTKTPTGTIKRLTLGDHIVEKSTVGNLTHTSKGLLEHNQVVLDLLQIRPFYLFINFSFLTI